MARPRDFVSDYDNIRMILKDIFFYGCYTVDDFEKRGISASSFNQEKRKLLGFLKSKHVKNQRINGKTAMHFSTDIFDVSYNFLFDTYMMKSFVESEVQLYILVLQILVCEDRELTQNDIADKICEITDEIDKTTLYRLLNKLEDTGYVTVNKKKTPFTYTLTKNTLTELSPDEFAALMNAVDLMRNVVYPSVSGNLLFDTMNRLRKIAGIPEEYQNPFLLKHSHFGQVLDDEVLWELILAVKDRHMVSFHYQQKDITDIIPVKIIIDECYGRRYLFAVAQKEAYKPGIFRIDKINRLSTGTKVSAAMTQLNRIYADQLKHSVTGAVLLNDGTPKKVELICKTEIEDNIRRHFPEAIITKTKEDEFTVTITVNDPIELKPFLRRFTGKITVAVSEEHTLAEEMGKELLEWRSLYEDFP